jgi:hypothetical protein
MNHEEVAENLLFPLWRCVSADFKGKYRSDAWGMFENFLKSSACSEDLKKFFDQFKRLIPMDWQHQYEKQVLAVIKAGKDYEVLSMLRSECSYLVLLTRDLNNQRNEQFKTEKNADVNS